MILERCDLGVNREGTVVKIRIKKGTKEVIAQLDWREAQSFFRSGMQAAVDAEREARIGGMVVTPRTDWPPPMETKQRR